MRILIVSAISEPQSFGGQMVSKAHQQLSALGHQVEISDLYAQEFPAVAYPADFPDRYDPHFFNLEKELSHSDGTGALMQQVRAEQDKIKAADLIIMAAPVYWSSPPAIMRGWIDQVFTSGLAYDRGQVFDNGLLKGKSAFFVMTHAGFLGAPNESLVSYKLESMLAELHERPFNYSGLQTLKPLSARPPYFKNTQERDEALTSICGQIIDNVIEAERLMQSSRNTAVVQPLVHLNGRPGTGKKTIGQRLAKYMNAAFVDNHTILNPAVRTCGRSTEGYRRIVTKVAEAVYEEMREELKKRPVVLTNALTNEVAEHRMLYDAVKDLSKKSGAPLFPVTLTVDFNENARRVVSPGRKKDLKLQDVDTLKGMYENFTLLSEEDAFTLDTTELTPAKSAKKIHSHIKKGLKR